MAVEISMVPVTSSNIKSVGYDDDENLLEIEFLNGGVYQYFGVPSSVHAGLMGAASKGQYFHQHIKEGNYRYQKVG